MRLAARAVVLGSVLNLLGIDAGEIAECIAIVAQDRAYDVCMATASDNDWTCEEIVSG
jgi:hypothetical protein